MKSYKIKTATLLVLSVFVFSSLVSILIRTESVLAYACTDKYEKWMSDKETWRETLNQCLDRVGAGKDCQDSANWQSGSQGSGEKIDICEQWYRDGFFGSKDCDSSRDPSGNNKRMCKKGTADRALYKTEYEDSRSPSGGGGGGSSGGGGGSSTSSGDSPTSPGSTGSETKPSKWQGSDEDVAVKKLAPGSVSVTKQQATDSGLFNISADNLIKGILNAVYSLVAITAVIAIVAAGIVIILADGDANKVATARRTIIYASAGLVIVGTAFIITGIVQGIGTQ